MNFGELIVLTFFLGFIGISAYLFLKPSKKVKDNNRRSKTTSNTKKQSSKKQPKQATSKKTATSKAPPKSGGKSTKGGKSKGKGKKKKQSLVSRLSTRIQDDRTRVQRKAAIDFANHPTLFSVIRGHLGPITAVAFSPHSTAGHTYVFVTSQDGYLSVWTDFQQGKQLAYEFGRVSTSAAGDGHPTALCVSKDGHTVIIATSGNERRQRRGKIMFYKFRNKRQVQKIEEESEKKEDASPLVLVHQFPSTNGETIDFIEVDGLGSASSYVLTASTANSTRLVMYRGKTGDEMYREAVNQLQNRNVQISHDGNSIVVATYQKSAHLYALQRNKTSATFEGLNKLASFGHTPKTDIHKAPLVTTVFSNDDRTVVTVGEDGVIGVWNIDVEYRLEKKPELLHHARMEDENFLPLTTAVMHDDSRTLALIGTRTVIFYNIADDQFYGDVGNLVLGDGGVLCASFNPDGTLLAIGGADADVRLYNVSQ